MGSGRILRGNSPVLSSGCAAINHLPTDAPSRQGDFLAGETITLTNTTAPGFASFSVAHRALGDIATGAASNPNRVIRPIEVNGTHLITLDTPKDVAGPHTGGRYRI